MRCDVKFQVIADNEILNELDCLITSVYRQRKIDPWKDGPYRAVHYDRLFRSKLSNWPFRNQTDLIYGSSTEIAFLLHPGYYIGVPTRDGLEVLIGRLGGQCYNALVEISHIGPYARIRFTRDSIDKETGRLVYEERDKPFRVEDIEFISSLRIVLSEEKIRILPVEILERIVPDVELDVTCRGSVTFYHCLFAEE